MLQLSYLLTLAESFFLSLGKNLNTVFFLSRIAPSKLKCFNLVVHCILIKDSVKFHSVLCFLFVCLFVFCLFFKNGAS